MLVLYKAGSTSLVRGVKCETKLVKVSQLQQALKEGWSTKLPGTSKAEPLKFIRKLAKDAKLKNYARRPLDELEAELNEISNNQ